MSGGSYEYLCFKDAGDLIANSEYLYEHMPRMVERLVEFDAPDAARETEDTILLIKAFQVRLQARLDRLQGVWKAVEWRDSGDYGDDQVRAAVAAYRGEGQAP